MKNIFAPWRSNYASDQGQSKQEGTTSDQCTFCSQLKTNNDDKNFILKRFKNSFVILNKYPYNAGHIMILPIKHVGLLNELSKEERSELMELANKSIEILQATLKNDGLNLGLNLGTAAGAGIPSHLHIHILPRWKGDTSFMSTIAETKVISFDLQKIYDQLKHAFDETD